VRSPSTRGSTVGAFRRAWGASRSAILLGEPRAADSPHSRRALAGAITLRLMSPQAPGWSRMARYDWCRSPPAGRPWRCHASGTPGGVVTRRGALPSRSARSSIGQSRAARESGPAGLRRQHHLPVLLRGLSGDGRGCPAGSCVELQDWTAPSVKNGFSFVQSVARGFLEVGSLLAFELLELLGGVGERSTTSRLHRRFSEARGAPKAFNTVRCSERQPFGHISCLESAPRIGQRILSAANPPAGSGQVQRGAAGLSLRLDHGSSMAPSPRRLAISVCRLAERAERSRRGAAKDACCQAFSEGVATRRPSVWRPAVAWRPEALEAVRETAKTVRVCRKPSAGQPTLSVLGQQIPGWVSALQWPAFMRWGTASAASAAVRGWVALLDDN